MQAPSHADSDEFMLVDCFAVHESDFDVDNVQVLQAYVVDPGVEQGVSGGNKELECDEDYVDDVEDEEEEAPIVAAPIVAAPKQGGRHEDMRMWTFEEDEALMGLVDHHGTHWATVVPKLNEELGGKPRTKSMIRNHYMRKIKGLQIKQEGKAKNRCGHCGELKSGHICKGSATNARAVKQARAAAEAEARANAKAGEKVIEAMAAAAQALAVRQQALAYERQIAAEAAAMVAAAAPVKPPPARGVRGVRGVVGGLTDEERAHIESLRARLVGE